MSRHSISLPLPTTTPRSSSSSSSTTSSPPPSPPLTGAATPWTHATTIDVVELLTPLTATKALPLPPSVLQPLRKDDLGKGFAVSAASRCRRADPPLQRIGWLVVIPGLMVSLLSAGLATSLLLYLAMRHDGDGDGGGGGFYVDEVAISGGREEGVRAPLVGLLASTIIVRFLFAVYSSPSLTLPGLDELVWLIGFPVLLSLKAYWAAASWLSYQQCPRSDQRPNLLTPLQYGLLFKLLSSPGPTSTYQVGSYIANGRMRVKTPAFFSTAFVLVSGILGVTYLISAADIWLHAAAAVVVIDAHSSLPRSHVSSALASSTSSSSDTPIIPAPPLRLRGHYPLAPTITYLTLLYLHTLLALTLTLLLLSAPRTRSPILESPPLPSSDLHPTHTRSTSTSTTIWPSPARRPTVLQLAHRELTDGLAPIAARLSSRRSMAGGGVLFVEDVNMARVEVGVWEASGRYESEGKTGGGGAGLGRKRSRWGDASADRVFGVYKKDVPYRGEIY
ncbi:hypothetical protein R3P38DRAFT_3460488 [Favolaschia claudopus]|uniref:Uncharacterized protein n=1 Tax=Favolaschia claudopus TaxID=2862362 RepID=A0AAW0CQC3_9AGAR